MESQTENLIIFDIKNEGDIIMDDVANIDWEIESPSSEMSDDSAVRRDVQGQQLHILMRS